MINSVEAHFPANAVMLFEFVIGAEGDSIGIALLIIGDAAAMERREVVVKRAEEVVLSVIG